MQKNYFFIFSLITYIIFSLPDHQHRVSHGKKNEISQCSRFDKVLNEFLERTAAVRNAVLRVCVHLGVGELVVRRLEHRVPPK
jgi:hypothetical protein